MTRTLRAADVVVDEAAVGAEPHEFAVVVRRFLQRGVEQAFAVVQQRGQAAELVDRPGQRWRALAQKVGDSERCRCSETRWRRRSDRGPATVRVIRRCSRSMASENWSPSLARVSTTVLRLSISCSIAWLLSAEIVGERRGLRQQRLQGAALALEDLQQRRGQRVDIVRIQSPDDRFQAARAADRDRVPVRCGRRGSVSPRQQPG